MAELFALVVVLGVVFVFFMFQSGGAESRVQGFLEKYPGLSPEARASVAQGHPYPGLTLQQVMELKGDRISVIGRSATDDGMLEEIAWPDWTGDSVEGIGIFKEGILIEWRLAPSGGGGVGVLISLD